MELKSDRIWVKVHRFERFNRTFMELKLRRGHFGIIISMF